MYSWGSGKYGQLGHATRLDERYPRRVEAEKSIGAFMQVSCGDRHTAAVTRKSHSLSHLLSSLVPCGSHSLLPLAPTHANNTPSFSFFVFLDY